MQFKDSKISFYLADTDCLDKILARRIGALTGQDESDYTFSNDEIDISENLAAVFDAIKSCADDSNFNKLLESVGSESAQTNNLVRTSAMNDALSELEKRCLEVNQVLGKQFVTAVEDSFSIGVGSDGTPALNICVAAIIKNTPCSISKHDAQLTDNKDLRSLTFYYKFAVIVSDQIFAGKKQGRFSKKPVTRLPSS